MLLGVEGRTGGGWSATGIDHTQGELHVLLGDLLARAVQAGAEPLGDLHTETTDRGHRQKHILDGELFLTQAQFQDVSEYPAAPLPQRVPWRGNALTSWRS